MESHYFYVDKAGPISKLRKALVHAKLGRDNRMVRTYKETGERLG